MALLGELETPDLSNQSQMDTWREQNLVALVVLFDCVYRHSLVSFQSSHPDKLGDPIR